MFMVLRQLKNFQKEKTQDSIFQPWINRISLRRLSSMEHFHERHSPWVRQKKKDSISNVEVYDNIDNPGI